MICLYIFCIIYQSKFIWQMILSQTKIFYLFPSAIQLGNILKMLTNNCDISNYILARDLWINRLYFFLSNESKNSYLTIDGRENQALPSIGQMQTVTLNNSVIMVKIQKIDLSISF